jgi:CBS domain-containing protein
MSAGREVRELPGSPGLQSRRAGDVMRKRWIEVSPLAGLRDTLQLMRLAGLRQVPVVSGGILLGLLDYRELAVANLRVGLGGPPPAGVTELLLQPGPEPPRRDSSLAEAVRRMALDAVACMPIVEASDAGPRLVGLLVESDLLRAAYDPWFVAASS